MSQRQSVRVIAIKDQSLLVMKRNKFGKEYYTLVGGTIEINETPEQTLQREVREETGLEVGAVRPVFMEDAGPMYGLQYVYLCEYKGGEPQLSSSSVEAALNSQGQNTYETMWLPFDQLPRVAFRSKSLQDALVKALRDGFPETPQRLVFELESVTR